MLEETALLTPFYFIQMFIWILWDMPLHFPSFAILVDAELAVTLTIQPYQPTCYVVCQVALPSTIIAIMWPAVLSLREEKLSTIKCLLGSVTSHYGHSYSLYCLGVVNELRSHGNVFLDLWSHGPLCRNSHGELKLD